MAVSLGSMVVGFTSAWSAGRVLAGLCIGVTSVSLPISLAEVLDPEVRGRVTRLSSSNWPLSRKLGRVALLHYTAGSVLDWSQVILIRNI